MKRSVTILAFALPLNIPTFAVSSQSPDAVQKKGTCHIHRQCENPFGTSANR